MQDIITNLGWGNRKEVAEFIGVDLKDLKQHPDGTVIIGKQKCAVGDKIAKDGLGSNIVFKKKLNV